MPELATDDCQRAERLLAPGLRTLEDGDAVADRCERVPQLVREQGEKLVLATIGLEKAPVGLLQRSLGTDPPQDVSSLATEQIEQPQRPITRPACAPLVRGKHSDRFARSAQEGRGLHRAHPGLTHGIEPGTPENRVVLDILDDDALAASERSSARSLPRRDSVPKLHPPDRHALVGCDLEIAGFGIEQLQGSAIGAADADGRVHDRGKHGLDGPLFHEQGADREQSVGRVQLRPHLLLRLAQLRDDSRRFRRVTGAALVVR